jgi:hypothetical protein
MVSIATNFNGQFTEIPSRRIVVASGQFTSMTCVWQGMEYDYPNWAPRRGSPHPAYPSMFAQTINREDRGGGLIEVSIVYYNKAFPGPGRLPGKAAFIFGPLTRSILPGQLVFLILPISF